MDLKNKGSNFLLYSLNSKTFIVGLNYALASLYQLCGASLNQVDNLIKFTIFKELLLLVVTLVGIARIKNSGYPNKSEYELNIHSLFNNI